MDKQYAPHVRLLTNNLNTINYWLKTGRDPNESEEDSEKASEDDKKDENEPKKSEPINDTHPLWLKNPSDCTEEEYKDFYRKVI